MDHAHLPERLRHDLTAAMRERDREKVRVLRTVLSAIANAEAQPGLDETPSSLRSDGPIAGATVGLGSAEVARRELDDELTAHGALDSAEGLRAEVAVLRGYLV